LWLVFREQLRYRFEFKNMKCASENKTPHYFSSRFIRTIMVK
jgi:hypothetical protein